MSRGISSSKSPRRHWTAGSPQQRRQYGVKDLVRNRVTLLVTWEALISFRLGGGQQQTGVQREAPCKWGSADPPPPKYCARTAREPEWQRSSPQDPGNLSPSRRGGAAVSPKSPIRTSPPSSSSPPNQLQSSNGDPAAGGTLHTCGWWGSGAARPLPESSRREPRSGRRTQIAPKPRGREVNAGGGEERRSAGLDLAGGGGEVAAPLGHAGNEGHHSVLLGLCHCQFPEGHEEVAFCKKLKKKIWAAL